LQKLNTANFLCGPLFGRLYSQIAIEGQNILKTYTFGFKVKNLLRLYDYVGLRTVVLMIRHY